MFYIILIPIAGIVFSLYYLVIHLPTQQRKEHEKYMNDDRDITERYMDDEPFKDTLKY